MNSLWLKRKLVLVKLQNSVKRRERDARAAASARSSMEQMMTQIAAGEVRELPLVIKSDVQGSLEGHSSQLR